MRENTLAPLHHLSALIEQCLASSRDVRLEAIFYRRKQGIQSDTPHETFSIVLYCTELLLSPTYYQSSTDIGRIAENTLKSSPPVMSMLQNLLDAGEIDGGTELRITFYPNVIHEDMLLYVPEPWYALLVPMFLRRKEEKRQTVRAQCAPSHARVVIDGNLLNENDARIQEWRSCHFDSEQWMRENRLTF